MQCGVISGSRAASMGIGPWPSRRPGICTRCTMVAEWKNTRPSVIPGRQRHTERTCISGQHLILDTSQPAAPGRLVVTGPGVSPVEREEFPRDRTDDRGVSHHVLVERVDETRWMILGTFLEEHRVRHVVRTDSHLAVPASASCARGTHGPAVRRARTGWPTVDATPCISWSAGFLGGGPMRSRISWRISSITHPASGSAAARRPSPAAPTHSGSRRSRPRPALPGRSRRRSTRLRATRVCSGGSVSNNRWARSRQWRFGSNSRGSRLNFCMAAWARSRSFADMLPSPRSINVVAPHAGTGYVGFDFQQAVGVVREAHQDFAPVVVLAGDREIANLEISQQLVLGWRSVFLPGRS